MDLATTHLSADLDGLASMVALSILEAPMEIGLPGSMDPLSHRFWTDHAAELPPLVAPRDLRARMEQEPLGRLRVGDTRTRRASASSASGPAPSRARSAGTITLRNRAIFRARRCPRAAPRPPRSSWR